MKQPKEVIVLDCDEKRLYNLPDTPVKCKIQEREKYDNSKVVYVYNPLYTLENSETETRILALCEGEYEVTEWTKD
jgi:hypothetical protein